MDDSSADMLGFTSDAPAAAPAAAFPPAMDYAPPAMDAGAADPMSFLGGGDPTPPPAAVPAAAPMGGPGYVDPFQGVPVTDSSGMGKTIPEMTALREWEQAHEADLEEIARKEEAAKKERRNAAAEELSKWHEDRKGDLTKRLSYNRKEEEAGEAARLEASKPGANAWERVVDLIDTNARTTDESQDISRMRTLLIQLKSNPVVSTMA